MGEKDYYDLKYAEANYFQHKEWMYAPFVKSLVKFAGLPAGSTVLDVGCGQGFFSYLLHKAGMEVCGIDISETGVEMAERSYGRDGLTFAARDICTVEFPRKFDCVFVRSCSLHNTDSFGAGPGTDHVLFKHLKPGGTFIFAFNSNFSKASDTCKHHSCEDVAQHFEDLPNGIVRFSTRIDAMAIGRLAFSPFMTRLNTRLSRRFGIGGDVVFVAKNVHSRFGQSQTASRP